MRSTSLMIGAVAAAVAVGTSSAFHLPRNAGAATPPAALYAKNDEGGSEFNIPNPLAELGNMLSNLDDVMDDFFNKRMGNGEIFYGKRKYNPSGNVDSEYNGGGFSDWRKIEAAREFREERARLREEAKEEERILRGL